MRRIIIVLCLWLGMVSVAQEQPQPLFDLPSSDSPLYSDGTLFVRRNGNILVSNPLLNTVAEIVPSTGQILYEIPSEPILILPDDTNTELRMFNGRFWVLSDEQITERAESLAPTTRLLWSDFRYSIAPEQGLSLAYQAFNFPLFPNNALQTTRAATLDPRGTLYISTTLDNPNAPTLDALSQPRLNILNAATLQVTPLSLDVIDQYAHLPSALELNSLRTILYVTYAGSNRLSAIDIRQQIRIGTYTTGALPVDMALSRDGLTLYIHNLLDNTIHVRDTQFLGLQNTLVTTQGIVPASYLEGAKLFFNASDERLSWNNSVSCNTCHTSPLDVILGDTREKTTINANEDDLAEFLQAHIQEQQGGTGITPLEIQTLISFLQG
jgi:hypothetical protein